MRLFPPFVVLLLSAAAARADVKPATLFADNMVLQRDMPLPVWGKADAGEQVVVSVGNRRAETVAGADGRWMLRLEPLEAGGPLELSIGGKNSLVFKNVLVGEVWVAGGQSNMEMRVSQADHGDEAAAAANDPQIRFFKTGGSLPAEPAEVASGDWQLCQPDRVKDWSAAAYFFAVEIRASEGVPVGILQSAAGWTVAESWTSRQTLAADPEFRYMLEWWGKWSQAYPHAKELYDHKRAEWQTAADAAKLAGQPAPPEPPAPMNPTFIHHPSLLFNGMIHPLVPFAIRGAIWYQGETSASRADQYRRLFPALIGDWRRHWKQGDFPFIFVQIAPLGANVIDLVDRAELRDAQREALAVKNTAMVVTIDIGEKDDEHPKNKQAVGHRLALAAERLAYGKDVPASGPLYKQMRVEGSTIRLTFSDFSGGLVAKNGGPLVGFSLAGADRKFVPAEARIDGDTVVVSAAGVAEPAAIRYAWANWPEFSLLDRAGLPASPFRTDNWPLTTLGEKRMLFEQIPLDEVTLTPKAK
jgi:sialate O-acetylesterase